MRSLVAVQRVHDGVDRGGDAMSMFRDPNFTPYGAAETALEMATIGGARALGWDDRIGSLEPGKEADIVVMDISEALHLTPKGSLIQELVYSGGANSQYVKQVYVGGKKVVDDSRPVGVDMRRAIEASDRLQDRVFEKLGIGRYRRGDTRWSWVQ